MWKFGQIISKAMMRAGAQQQIFRRHQTYWFQSQWAHQPTPKYTWLFDPIVESFKIH